METNKNEVAIIQKDSHMITAVFRNRRLDNLIIDDVENNSPNVGDIYVGRVSHIVQNINAAFIEIQKNVMCYMPLNEVNSFDGKVVQGQLFPVQIKKAAVKTKQAVASRKLEFTGRYAVITTINTTKSISSKITSTAERARLASLLEMFQEEDLGIILRTSCDGVDAVAIQEECELLLKQAHDVIQRSQTRSAFTSLFIADTEYMKYLRNFPEHSFARIVTDVPEVYQNVKQQLLTEEECLQLYEDRSYSLDKLLGISSKLEKALAKHVWLKSGGSLVIEPTEALTVIDVNTEKAIAGKRNSETTFYKLNCEAAIEAARQIRIRNISGIILIDFIDMKKQEHIDELLHLLGREFEKDDIRTTVVDMTKLGLVEITRMKVRKPLWESLSIPNREKV